MADPKHIQGFLTGGTVAAPNAEQVLAVMVACAPGQIRTVACASASGTGGNATIIDVRKNTVSVYANPAHRPTLPAGQTGKFSSYKPDNSTVQPGDVLAVVCAQAGGHANVIATLALEEP